MPLDRLFFKLTAVQAMMRYRKKLTLHGRDFRDKLLA
jgi:hypothetical protein